MTIQQQHHHEQARMAIDMPSEEHKRLKAMAAFMGIKDLVFSCLRDYLISDNETLKAFQETDERKELV
ncbi:Uncharacterized protein PHSC3_001721 [Chlamydiales bacterium STE3]|nr:Uncharacterized protein PHSC3_001721 [Chlamydiales bacterium STE3]